MPYELFLALRYLYARRRRRLARVTTVSAIVGIAVGVAALIVALSLSNGFRDEMRDKILKGTAHITLMRRDGRMMTDWREQLERVRLVEGVSDAAATTYEGALLSGPRGSAYAVLRGLDRESARATTQLRRTMIAGTIEPLLHDAPPAETGSSASPAANDASKQNDNTRTEDKPSPAITSFDEAPSEAAMPAVVLGAELAERAGLRTNDVGQIISGETTLTPLGPAPRYRRVRVAGIFRSGLYEYDTAWVYVSLQTAASFAGQTAPAASVISIEVADIYAVSLVNARVRERMGDEFTTVDWQEANRQLFTALALERRMGLIILALIILIAALNITTTLVLVVVERRADIAILSAMGARARSIMCVFIIEGACVGLIGALFGVLLGLAACFAGDRYRLVSLPPDVYSLSSVPFHTEARDVALAALVAFLLSLLATIYPARAAARVRPAEALRDTN
ncbi:MAG: lipoprotein-releasing system permease protein [Blastocatellia bacterium]|jgi:lipoprotein-releasing system permease protein|nr:lipoprotein-releasing system permease protein [Blastocatellia bacterium]